MSDPASPSAPAPGKWAWLVSNPERTLALLFLLALPLTNPYLRGDGVGYYAYLRSVVIDGDLDFENEYRRGDPAFVQLYFDPEGRLRPEMVSPGGRVRNQWAVGPSLLWTPFFLLAHGATGVLNLLGAGIPADGYSAPYRWSCAIGTACYGFLGLLLARRIASGVASPGSSLAATIGIWLASSLPVYMHLLPFQAHAAAAFTVSLFLWCWLRTRSNPSPGRWAAWGLAAGLMAETYYLDGILLILVPIEAVRLLRAGAARRPVPGWLACFGAAAAVAMIPHGLTRWMLDGPPMSTGYGEQLKFFWTSPRLWKVAFSSEHGLFLWTPILIPAVAGLILLARRDRWTAGPLVASFAAFYFVVASYLNWHGQSSFGSRFFVSLAAPFILGLSVSLDRLAGRVRGTRWSFVASPATIAAILGMLALWNGGIIFQWSTGLMPKRGPVDIAATVRNQVTEVPRRAGGFLVRYFMSRESLQKEVERQDLEEMKTYQLRR